MNKSSVFTIALGAVAAVAAGGLTLALTSPKASSEAQAATVMESSPIPIVGPVESAPPQSKPVKSVDDEAREAGLDFHLDWQGDKVGILSFYQSTKGETKAALLHQLNDPFSAQFRNVYMTAMSGRGGVFCGEVNAKHEFGGYTEFRPFYGLGRTVQINDGSQAFAGMMDEFCFQKQVVGVISNF